MRVLGISGSLRRGSHNTKLLRAAGEIVERHGGRFELFDGLRAIPPYDEDDDVGAGPCAVAKLRRAIADADAVLFATPEYNSSIPGALKNAVDWASRPRGAAAMAGKPAAVLGASGSPNAAKWAREDGVKVLRVAGADVIDATVGVGS